MFNFNIVDGSVNDVPVTKEQVAAEIVYDIEKVPDNLGLNYIVVNLDV